MTELHIYQIPDGYLVRLRWGAAILEERTFPTADAIARYAQQECRFARIVLMQPDLAYYVRWVLRRYGIILLS